MALWEYKVITSGVHGFATPALLEAYLNSLGKEEWEIINYQPQPNNPLAFTGVVRRSTQRDWVPPEIPVTAAPPQTQTAKPVAQHETHAAPKANEPQRTTAEPQTNAQPDTEHLAPANGTATAEDKPKDAIRTFRDTARDQDPDAEDDESTDEWDDLDDLDDDLPTFFDALKPHFRNNQKGPGQSVGVEFLMKRWGLTEADIVGALKECGLTIPETEDAIPEYFEFEDDLFWVNRTNRGQLFINSREKPRPVFRTVPAKALSTDDPAYAELAAEHAAEKARTEKRNAERAEQQAAAAARAEETAKRRAEAKAKETTAQTEGQTAETGAPASDAAPAETNNTTATPGAPLKGDALLDRIRPMMRRNRHGPGYSGSVSYLARALKISENDFIAALAEMNLHVPATTGEKPAFVEIEKALYWVNKDNRGGIWINGRENKNGNQKASAQTPPAENAPAEQTAHTTETDTQTELPIAPAPAETPATVISNNDDDTSPLSAVRLLLKPNKRGSGVSGEVGYLARTLNKNETEFVAALTHAGLIVPPDADAKPTFVEHGGEIYWFSFFEKDGATSIWLNAKPAKKKTDRAPRTRKTKAGKASE